MADRRQLEPSAPEGMAFAWRLSQPEDSAMTCGIVVPVDRNLIEEVTLDPLAWRRGDPEHVAQDPRFAIAIYRAVCCGFQPPIIALGLVAWGVVEIAFSKMQFAGRGP